LTKNNGGDHRRPIEDKFPQDNRQLFYSNRVTQRTTSKRRKAPPGSVGLLGNVSKEQQQENEKKVKWGEFNEYDIIENFDRIHEVFSVKKVIIRTFAWPQAHAPPANFVWARFSDDKQEVVEIYFSSQEVINFLIYQFDVHHKLPLSLIYFDDPFLPVAYHEIFELQLLQERHKPYSAHRFAEEATERAYNGSTALFSGTFPDNYLLSFPLEDFLPTDLLDESSIDYHFEEGENARVTRFKEGIQKLSQRGWEYLELDSPYGKRLQASLQKSQKLIKHDGEELKEEVAAWIDLDNGGWSFFYGVTIGLQAVFGYSLSWDPTRYKLRVTFPQHHVMTPINVDRNQDPLLGFDTLPDDPNTLVIDLSVDALNKVNAVLYNQRLEDFKDEILATSQLEMIDLQLHLRFVSTYLMKKKRSQIESINLDHSREKIVPIEAYMTADESPEADSPKDLKARIREEALRLTSTIWEPFHEDIANDQFSREAWLGKEELSFSIDGDQIWAFYHRITIGLGRADNLRIDWQQGHGVHIISEYFDISIRIPHDDFPFFNVLFSNDGTIIWVVLADSVLAKMSKKQKFQLALLRNKLLKSRDQLKLNLNFESKYKEMISQDPEEKKSDDHHNDEDEGNVVFLARYRAKLTEDPLCDNCFIIALTELTKSYENAAAKIEEIKTVLRSINEWEKAFLTHEYKMLINLEAAMIAMIEVYGEDYAIGLAKEIAITKTGAFAFGDVGHVKFESSLKNEEFQKYQSLYRYLERSSPDNVWLGVKKFNQFTPGKIKSRALTALLGLGAILVAPLYAARIVIREFVRTRLQLKDLIESTTGSSILYELNYRIVPLVMAIVIWQATMVVLPELQYLWSISIGFVLLTVGIIRGTKSLADRSDNIEAFNRYFLTHVSNNTISFFIFVLPTLIFSQVHPVIYSAIIGSGIFVFVNTLLTQFYTSEVDQRIKRKYGFTGIDLDYDNLVHVVEGQGRPIIALHGVSTGKRFSIKELGVLFPNRPIVVLDDWRSKGIVTSILKAGQFGQRSLANLDIIYLDRFLEIDDDKLRAVLFLSWVVQFYSEANIKPTKVDIIAHSYAGWFPYTIKYDLKYFREELTEPYMKDLVGQARKGIYATTYAAFPYEEMLIKFRRRAHLFYHYGLKTVDRFANRELLIILHMLLHDPLVKRLFSPFKEYIYNKAKIHLNHPERSARERRESIALFKEIKQRREQAASLADELSGRGSEDIVVVGKNDAVTPPHTNEHFARDIGASFELIEAGHDLIYEPDFAQVLVKWQLELELKTGIGVPVRLVDKSIDTKLFEDAGLRVIDINGKNLVIQKFNVGFVAREVIPRILAQWNRKEKRLKKTILESYEYLLAGESYRLKPVKKVVFVDFAAEAEKLLNELYDQLLNKGPPRLRPTQARPTSLTVKIADTLNPSKGHKGLVDSEQNTIILHKSFFNEEKTIQLGILYNLLISQISEGMSHEDIQTMLHTDEFYDFLQGLGKFKKTNNNTHAKTTLTMPSTYKVGRWLGKMISFGKWTPSNRFIEIVFSWLWEFFSPFRPKTWLDKHNIDEYGNRQSQEQKELREIGINFVWKFIIFGMVFWGYFVIKNDPPAAYLFTEYLINYEGISNVFIIMQEAAERIDNIFTNYPNTIQWFIYQLLLGAALGRAIGHIIYNILNPHAPLTIGDDGSKKQNEQKKPIIFNPTLPSTRFQQFQQDMNNAIKFLRFFSRILWRSTLGTVESNLSAHLKKFRKDLKDQNDSQKTHDSPDSDTKPLGLAVKSLWGWVYGSIPEGIIWSTSLHMWDNFVTIMKGDFSRPLAIATGGRFSKITHTLSKLSNLSMFLAILCSACTGETSRIIEPPQSSQVTITPLKKKKEQYYVMSLHKFYEILNIAAKDENILKRITAIKLLADIYITADTQSRKELLTESQLMKADIILFLKSISTLRNPEESGAAKESLQRIQYHRSLQQGQITPSIYEVGYVKSQKLFRLEYLDNPITTLIQDSTVEPEIEDYQRLLYEADAWYRATEDEPDLEKRREMYIYSARSYMVGFLIKLALYDLDLMLEGSVRTAELSEFIAEYIEYSVITGIFVAISQSNEPLKVIDEITDLVKDLRKIAKQSRDNLPPIDEETKKQYRERVVKKLLELASKIPVKALPDELQKWNYKIPGEPLFDLPDIEDDINYPPVRFDLPQPVLPLTGSSSPVIEVRSKKREVGSDTPNFLYRHSPPFGWHPDRDKRVSGLLTSYLTNKTTFSPVERRKDVEIYGTHSSRRDDSKGRTLKKEQRIFSVNLDSGIEEDLESINRRKQMVAGKLYYAVNGYGFIFGRLEADELLYVEGCYTCAAVTLLAKNIYSQRIKGAAHLFMNTLSNSSYVEKLLRVIHDKELTEVVVMVSFSGAERYSGEANQEEQLKILGSQFTNHGVGFIGFMRGSTPETKAWVNSDKSTFDFYINKGSVFSHRNITIDDTLVGSIFDNIDFNHPPSFIVKQNVINNESIQSAKATDIKRLTEEKDINGNQGNNKFARSSRKKFSNKSIIRSIGLILGMGVSIFLGASAEAQDLTNTAGPSFLTVIHNFLTYIWGYHILGFISGSLMIYSSVRLYLGRNPKDYLALGMFLFSAWNLPFVLTLTMFETGWANGVNQRVLYFIDFIENFALGAVVMAAVMMVKLVQHLRQQSGTIFTFTVTLHHDGKPGLIERLRVKHNKRKGTTDVSSKLRQNKKLISEINVYWNSGEFKFYAEIVRDSRTYPDVGHMYGSVRFKEFNLPDENNSSEKGIWIILPDMARMYVEGLNERMMRIENKLVRFTTESEFRKAHLRLVADNSHNDNGSSSPVTKLNKNIFRISVIKRKYYDFITLDDLRAVLKFIRDQKYQNELNNGGNGLTKEQLNRFPLLIRNIYKVFNRYILPDINISGLDNIPHEGSVLFALNHINVRGLDGIIFVALIAHHKAKLVRFVSDTKQVGWSSRWLVAQSGGIALEQGKTVSKTVTELLKPQTLVGIFPAGTASKTPQRNIELFRRSTVGRIAIETNDKANEPVWVVPVIIKGELPYHLTIMDLLKRAINNEGEIKEMSLEIHIGEPIDPSLVEISQSLRELAKIQKKSPEEKEALRNEWKKLNSQFIEVLIEKMKGLLGDIEPQEEQEEEIGFIERIKKWAGYIPRFINRRLRKGRAISENDQHADAGGDSNREGRNGNRSSSPVNTRTQLIKSNRKRIRNLYRPYFVRSNVESLNEHKSVLRSVKMDSLRAIKRKIRKAPFGQMFVISERISNADIEVLMEQIAQLPFEIALAVYKSRVGNEVYRTIIKGNEDNIILLQPNADFEFTLDIHTHVLTTENLEDEDIIKGLQPSVIDFRFIDIREESYLLFLGMLWKYEVSKYRVEDKYVIIINGKKWKTVQLITGPNLEENDLTNEAALRSTILSLLKAFPENINSLAIIYPDWRKVTFNAQFSIKDLLDRAVTDDRSSSPVLSNIHQWAVILGTSTTALAIGAESAGAVELTSGLWPHAPPGDSTYLAFIGLTLPSWSSFKKSLLNLTQYIKNIKNLFVKKHVIALILISSICAACTSSFNPDIDPRPGISPKEAAEKRLPSESKASSETIKGIPPKHSLLGQALVWWWRIIYAANLIDRIKGTPPATDQEETKLKSSVIAGLLALYIGLSAIGKPTPGVEVNMISVEKPGAGHEAAVVVGTTAVSSPVYKLINETLYGASLVYSEYRTNNEQDFVGEEVGTKAGRRVGRRPASSPVKSKASSPIDDDQLNIKRGKRKAHLKRARLALARKYLEEHGSITPKIYSLLLGQRPEIKRVDRSVRRDDLKELAQTSDDIKVEGYEFGNRVYVLTKPESDEGASSPVDFGTRENEKEDWHFSLNPEEKARYKEQFKEAAGISPGIISRIWYRRPLATPTISFHQYDLAEAINVSDPMDAKPAVFADYTEAHPSFKYLVKVEEGYFAYVLFDEENKTAIYAPRHYFGQSVSFRAKKGDQTVIGHAHIKAAKRNIEVYRKYKWLIQFLKHEANGFEDIQLYVTTHDRFEGINVSTKVLVKWARDAGITVFPPFKRLNEATDMFVTKDGVSLQVRPNIDSDLSQAKYTSVYWINYPFSMFNKGPSGKGGGVFGLLVEAAENLRERMVSGKAGEHLVSVSDGAVRVLHQPLLMEAIRTIIAVLENRRINAKLWIDNKTGKPIRLTSDKFIMYAKDDHIEDLQRAVHGLLLPEYFLSHEEPRILSETDRRLIKRYFDETEDGFYRPKPRLLRNIRFTLEDQKADLQLYNFKEREAEIQDPYRPIATNDKAHEKLAYFKEGGFFITTADKWYELFFELTTLKRRKSYFYEGGVEEIPIYLMQYLSIDYSDEWFDQMFNYFLDDLEQRLIELYEAGLIQIDPDRPVNIDAMYGIWNIAKEGYSDLYRKRGQPYIIHPLRIILRTLPIS